MLRFLGFVACATLFLGFSAIAIFFLTPLGYLGLCLYYGWVLFAFIHYRQVRQQEILHLITTAVSTQAPLAPAFAAYLADRPRTLLRELWVCTLLFFIVPFILPFIYVVSRRPSFDLKVSWVAQLLREGCSLHTALHAVPGVVSKETLLAVAVGQQTNKLDQCLQNVPRYYFGSKVTELLPAVLYPLALIPIILGVFAFQMVFIVPKFEKIYADLGMRFPPITEMFVSGARWMVSHAWAPFMAVASAIILAGLLFSSDTVRWYFPLLGRLYRMQVQSRLLHMLALLLDAGKTLPEALGVLARSGYFPPTVRRRVDRVRAAIERGEPLPANMQKQGLMPRSMTPLLQAAERSRNIVWALGEMGLTLSNRLIRRSQRIVAMVFPLMIMAVGAVVGAYAAAMFLPLVQIITHLSEL